MSVTLAQFLNPVKAKLAPLMQKLEPWIELLKEKSAPLVERLEALPYYPYSVVGVVVVILLLLIVRRRLSPKKRSPANRSKAAVSGVAVGLSSHEEYHGKASVENADVFAAPFPTAESTNPFPTAASTNPFPTAASAAPFPTAASTNPFPTAASTNPFPTAASAAPFPTAASANPFPAAAAPTATAPEPHGSSADQAHDQVFYTCQERFHAIYMDMYIELGLATDFEQFRMWVANRFKSKETYHAVSDLKMEPEGVVLLQMAIAAGNTLQSGASHTGKGQLDVHGRELFAVYRYALNTMLEKGLASQADVLNKINLMEKTIQELGE